MSKFSQTNLIEVDRLIDEWNGMRMNEWMDDVRTNRWTDDITMNGWMDCLISYGNAFNIIKPKHKDEKRGSLN